MHQTSISPAILERVTKRRGRARLWEALDPARTALVVIDMQNAFVMPDVWLAPCPVAQEIVPGINSIARALRAAGGTVVWVKTVATPENIQSWSNFHAMSNPVSAAYRNEALTPGHVGHELWQELDVQPADPILLKEVFSAFQPGPGDLPALLRKRDIDTVIISGTLTNVCCESSGRDAMMMNFKTIMVSDANAALSDEEHGMSLNLFYASFGDVSSSEEVIAAFSRSPA